MSFFKNEEQEGKTGLVWGLVLVGGERRTKGKGKRDDCSGNIVYEYIKMEK
jgi:hypothetical protein